MDCVDRLITACGALIEDAEPIACSDGDKEYVISEETFEELQIALTNVEAGQFI